MRALLSLFSSVFVGWILAATNFAPIIGWQRFVENRRRVYSAVVLFGVSIFVLLAAVLMASMDLVIQYEDQGFIFWNPILAIAAVCGALGVLLIWSAHATLPKAEDYFVFSSTGIVQNLKTMFTSQVGDFAAATTAPNVTSAAPAASAAPTREPEPSPETSTDPAFAGEGARPSPYGEPPVYAH